MAGQRLPTITIKRLETEREEAANKALTFIVDRLLGDPVSTSSVPVAEMIVTCVELGLICRGFDEQLSAVQDAVGKSLARVSEILTRPYHLKFEAGSVRMVGDVPRRDLLETLVKLRAVLAEPNDSQVRLRLVPQAIRFTDACYNYRWRGTIFEFTSAFNPGINRPRYVAWHPSSTYRPAPKMPKHLADLCRIGPIQHRTHSEQRGQDR